MRSAPAMGLKRLVILASAFSAVPASLAPKADRSHCESKFFRLKEWYVASGSVPALVQRHFALLTVTSSWRELLPQVRAHAGRTNEKALEHFCSRACRFGAAGRN